MSRTLGRIAILGLSVGVISLALAFALGGRDLDRLFAHRIFAGPACDVAAGSDKPSERRLAWAGGDAIDIALPATVRVRAGEGSEIVVRGSPDTIANVELRGGRLVLNCRWTTGSRDTEIVLPGRAFRSVKISGAAKVVMEKLNQPELALTISGSGSVAGQGAVDQLSVVISGSGNARLAEVAARQITVRISGSGNVEAAPKEDADISISGSGNVRLLSRPARLKTHIAGSGRISQLAPEAAEGKK